MSDSDSEEQIRVQLEKEIEREMAATAAHTGGAAAAAGVLNPQTTVEASPAAEFSTESLEAHPPQAPRQMPPVHKDPLDDIFSSVAPPQPTVSSTDADDMDVAAKERFEAEVAAAEAKLKEEQQREAQRRREAEAVARAKAEQQALIDAAVAERLRKAKEEAEAKQKQRQMEEEIERRVAAALAEQAEAERQQRAQAEAARKAKEDAEEKVRLEALAKEKQQKEMEAEVERRIREATEARLKAALAAAGVPSDVTQKVTGTVAVASTAPTTTSTTAARAAATSTPETAAPLHGAEKEVDDEATDESTSDASDDDKSTDDDNENNNGRAATHASSDASDTDAQEHSADRAEAGQPGFSATSHTESDANSSRAAPSIIENRVEPALLPHTSNGCLSHSTPHDRVVPVLPPEERVPATWSLAASAEYSEFERSVEEAVSTRPATFHDDMRKRVSVQRWETQREQGRCLAPEGEAHASLDHVAVQLGFFRAQQAVVSYVPSLYPSSKGKHMVADREPSTGSVASRPLPCKPPRPLSTAHFFFEADILKTADVTADADEEEDYPHNHPEECLVPVDAVVADARAAAIHGTSSFACGDLMQVYEKARGRRFEKGGPQGSPGNPVPPPAMTVTTGPFSSKLWVHDLETKKPISVTPMFSGGCLLKFDVKRCQSQVDQLHGDGTDALFFSAAVYSVHTKQQIAVSDTFYFESHGYTFLPHRQPSRVFRSFVTFIPNEFKAVPLYLCIRAYRISGEDQDQFIDLYTRPSAYKAHHVVPMKQEAQQLAMCSEVLEEMGWISLSLNSDGKLTQGTLKADKLYRGSKSTGDVEMFKHIMDNRKSGFKSINVDLEIDVADITTYEFSFPTRRPVQPAWENESLIEYLDPDTPNARRHLARYAPCCLPILTSGHFHAYHHVAYFRLQSLKLTHLSNTKYPGTHYSFVIQVAVKNNDEDASEEGLPVMYNRWFGERPVQTSAFSSTYHWVKEFDLADEFKIQLPQLLTEKHHIFLTLYAANFKKPSPTSKDPRLVKIGYAAVPILNKESRSLALRESLDIKVVSSEHMASFLPGYLDKMATATNTGALLNNGSYAIRAGLLGRSSIYASNTTISTVFKNLPASLSSLIRNDRVLKHCGELHLLRDNAQQDVVHDACLAKINELPLPEIMAFYPLLTGYCLALVSSPSSSVTVSTRLASLRALVEFTSKAHGYDLSTKSLVNRRSGRGPSLATSAGSTPPGCVRTCTVNLLYHYVTNDLLYLAPSSSVSESPLPSSSKQTTPMFRTYAGVAETLVLLLESMTGSSSVAPKGDLQQLLLKINDLLWFFLDLILRSLYLTAHDSKSASKPSPPQQRGGSFASPLKKDTEGSAGSARTVDTQGFFQVLLRLVDEVLKKLVPIGGVVTIQRLAHFVRNLAFVCDRGMVLHLADKMLARLESHAVPTNVQAALRVLLDDDDAWILMCPLPTQRAPAFLLATVIKYLGPQLFHQVREVRLSAATLLYNTVCRLVNSRRIASSELTLIARHMIALLSYASENWQLYRQLSDPKPPPGNAVPTAVHQSPSADRRPLLAVLMWILHLSPEEEIREWCTALEPKHLAGFMCLVADAQSAFRYNHGKDKYLPDQQKLPADIAEGIADADARLSTFVHLIGCRVLSNLCVDVRSTLDTLRQEKASAAVFPFFLLLEALLSFHDSTASLQVSCCVLHQVVTSLMPEILSRRARMSSGIVLLAIRMLSAAQLHVRLIARQTVEAITKFYYGLTGSLGKLKNHVANALVAVAESKARDLRLAGVLVERHILEITRSADATTSAGASSTFVSEDEIRRYVPDQGDESGDAAMKYHYTVHPLFVSAVPQLPPVEVVLHRAAERRQRGTSPDTDGITTYGSEMKTMSRVMLSLFRDVLRLQIDDAMKFKEQKASAYLEIAENFLKQNTLKEVLKWTARLHETHKTNQDFCEAGLTLLFSAALGFRMTEAFYAIKGSECRGARLQFATFTHVVWHDYVRIMPELDRLVALENVYTMVQDLTLLPDEPPFTLEGQVRLMKEAAEFLDKNGYYELSIKAVQVVDKYLMAKMDYKGSAVIHHAIHTWATAIATNAAKRQSFRYYFVWARMEREVGALEQALLRKLRKRKDSDSDDEEDPAKKGKVPEMLSSPIKLIYKQPSNSTLAEFTAKARQFVLAQLPNEALIVLTDDMTPTLPAIESPAFVEGGKLPKELKHQLKSPNRCLLTVTEVTPAFPSLHPGVKELDRSHVISQFEHVNRVGAAVTTKAAGDKLSRAQHVSTNLPRSEIDVMRQQLSVNVHHTVRAFPSMTLAIPVGRSEEEMLSPFDTAIETMNAELDALEASPPTSLSAILRCLTPLGVVPPGTYYKCVVSAMSHNHKVLQTVREALRVCRERLAKCEDNGEPIQKSPENYALILKGLADVECALIDFPEDAVDSSSPPAAVKEADTTDE